MYFTPSVTVLIYPLAMDSKGIRSKIKITFNKVRKLIFLRRKKELF